MQLKSALAVVLSSSIAALTAPGLQAKATAEQATALDGAKLTCNGAEKAGSPSGVAEYTGKWMGTWPGQTKPYGYEPGPYKDEKPIETITAANVARFADKLTEGQKSLLAKYSNYKMLVYPSHRDFRNADWVCAAVKKNATTAEVVHDGKGVTGISGAIPFPFANTGLEAIWNIINPHRAWTESSTYDIADVYSNGNIAWGRITFKTLDPGRDPAKRGSYQDKIGAYFYQSYLLPERDKGFTAVGYQPNDFNKDATSSWQYLPGLRRVRQAPEVGFDYPVPPAGLRTVDDDYVFNGSPERYTWKLVGKKEIYIPYHNFKLQDPSIKYKDLIQPNTINPDYVRYELHRVWVVEGTLKKGMRHIYGKRMLYADEDTWMAMWADNYDSRDQLYRTAFAAYFYSQESKAFHRGATIYHDLQAKAYEAGYLNNEQPDGSRRVNIPLKPDEFSPDAAGRAGR